MVGASLRYSQPPLEKVQDNIVSSRISADKIILVNTRMSKKAKYTVEMYSGQQKVSTLLTDRIEKMIKKATKTIFFIQNLIKIK